LRGVDIEPGGELFGQPFVQQPRAAVGLDAQQLRPEDGNHAALFDEAEEVVPRVLVKLSHHLCGGVHYIISFSI
jgi:hypothetical protein